MSASALRERLARDINCLSDADKFKRKRALIDLAAALLDKADKPAIGDAVALFEAEMCKPVLRAFGDASEMNREAAIAFVTRLLAADASGAAHAALAPSLLPAIASRVGKYPPAEESEELRLQLSRLTNTLLAKPSCKDFVAAQVSDVGDLLKAQLSDAFHSVKVEAAAAVGLLVDAAAPRVHLVMSPLVAALVPNLGHQRGPVRLAGLEALHALLPWGAESLARTLSETVLPVLKTHLRFDRTPSVRRQLAVTAGHWLATLPSYLLASASGASGASAAAGGGGGGGGGGPIDAQLLLLLSGLMADELPDVSAQAQASYEQACRARASGGAAAAGAATAATGGASASSSDSGSGFGGADLDAAAAAASGTADDDGDETLVPAAASAVTAPEDAGVSGEALALLPVPFHAHPVSREALATTQRLLPYTLPLALAELKDWTVRVRVFAAGALRSLCCLSQGGIAAHLDPIITALCAGSRDEEAGVRSLLGGAGQLLGLFVPPDNHLAVLLPQLQGRVSGLNNSQHYTAALAVLSAATSRMSRVGLLPHLQALATTLASPHLAEDDPPALRHQLALALQSVVGVVVGAPNLLATSLFHHAHTSSSGAAAATTGSSSLTAPLAVAPSPLTQAVAAFTGRGRRFLSADDHHHGSGGGGALAYRRRSWSTGSASDSADATAPVDVEAAARAALADPTTLDSLVLCFMHLCDGASSDEDAHTAHECARAVAHALHCAHTTDLLAGVMHRVLPGVVASASSWSKASHERRVFDTIIRVARPALSGRSFAETATLVASAVDAFCRTLAPSKEPDLRVAMLACLDAFIVGRAPLGVASAPPAPHAAGAAAGSAAAAAGSPASSATAPSAAASASAGRLMDASDDAAGTGTSPAVTLLPHASHPPSFHRMDVPPSKTLAAGTGVPTVVREAMHELAAAEAAAAVAAAAAAAAGTTGDAPADSTGIAPGHIVSDVTVDQALADVSGSLVQRALIPNAVWRAGLVASTIRKAAVACLLGLADRHLLPVHVLAPLLPEAQPVLKSCLSDDDAATRHLTVRLFGLVFGSAGRGYDGDLLRDVYHDVLKRLDDSNDGVRVAACDALVWMAGCVQAADRASVVTHYTVETLLVHLDDSNPSVQRAALGAALAFSALAPGHAAKHAMEARKRFRRPEVCDQLLVALVKMAEEEEAAAAAAAMAAAASSTA